jgi:protein arginine kinase
MPTPTPNPGSFDGGTPNPTAFWDRATEWLRGDGPESDVVLSSRVRLARNLVGFPFVHRCSREDRLAVMGMVRRRLESFTVPQGGSRIAPADVSFGWIPIHELSAVDRTLLVERHLISNNLAKGYSTHGAKTAKPPEGAAEFPRAVAHGTDDRHAVMVNEEDHLRIQVIASGLALDQAAEQADRLDDFLEEGMELAFSPRFGYLTACPTNAGTGIRCSVMLHLPALRLSGEIEKVKRAAHDMTLAVRGFYGEGSDALADLYQISNQTTLGKTERVIRHELSAEILPKVIEYERIERHKMLEKKRRLVEDQAWRALALLRHARLLTTEETLAALSLMRLGSVLGLLPGVEPPLVNHLLLLCQPAHLQAVTGRTLDPERARAARADLMRERLAKIA